MKGILCCLLLLASHAFGQFAIGHTTLTFNDPSRTGGFGSGGGSGRQIQTEIYYPSTSAGTSTPVASGEFPVIVFGHGFAMSWDAYNDIWEHYVPRGYIMAFVRTEGSLIPSPSHGDFGLDLALVAQKNARTSNNKHFIPKPHCSESRNNGTFDGRGSKFLSRFEQHKHSCLDRIGTCGNDTFRHCSRAKCTRS